MIRLNGPQSTTQETELTVPAMLEMLHQIETETSSDLVMEPVACVVREAILMLKDLRQIAYEAMLEADTEWLPLEADITLNRPKLC